MIGFLLGHLGALSLLSGGLGALFFPEAALTILKTIGALPKPVFIVGCGLLAFLFVRAEGESRHWHKQSDRYEKLYNQEHSGRVADRKSYVNAQASAAQLNQKQVAKVEQQQQKVTDDVETRYRADLARLHAEQLRRPQAQRPASGSGASQASAAPSGPSSEAVPLSGPELLQAQETELQLNALIDWVTAQSAIDPNAH